MLIPILLFVGTWLIYKNIYPDPRNWYDHYLHLAKSILVMRVDMPNLPQFYHDKIEFEGKIYVPFPPGASFALLPFLIIDGNVTQQQASIILGSINIAIIYILLTNFTSQKNSVLLSLFFGFGTSFFWSAVVGTTWFFAHVVLVFFLTTSLLFHFKKLYFLSGVFFALAVLTRMSVILSGIFFLLELFKTPKKFLSFLMGAFIFIPIFFSYNYLRFGDVFETGYKKVYQQYKNSNLKYSVGQKFNYFDVRNIPSHLYAFLSMPPDISISDGTIRQIRPSPFGMGVLFTSPLLFLALLPKFKNKRELNLYIGSIFAAIPVFMHYAQGWVQFGYRFVLDFIVFLMIILTIRFKPTVLNLTLILISVIVNFWGVLWAIELGW